MFFQTPLFHPCYNQVFKTKDGQCPAKTMERARTLQKVYRGFSISLIVLQVLFTIVTGVSVSGAMDEDHKNETSTVTIATSTIGEYVVNNTSGWCKPCRVIYLAKYLEFVLIYILYHLFHTKKGTKLRGSSEVKKEFSLPVYPCDSIKWYPENGFVPSPERNDAITRKNRATLHSILPFLWHLSWPLYSLICFYLVTFVCTY